MRKKNSQICLVILVTAILTTIGYAELKDFLSVNGNVTLRKGNICKKLICDFDYTGSEQIFIAPESGYYMLETWGAQGGNAKNKIGGYGGYSKGYIYLDKNQRTYINVGGNGSEHYGYTIKEGGYNGGGNAVGTSDTDKLTVGTGGGATHIATNTGLLSTLEENKNKILIASGGGGGAIHYTDTTYFANGGSGGGYFGNSPQELEYILYEQEGIPTGGTQISGGIGTKSRYYTSKEDGYFGHGANASLTNFRMPGGGGGFYGGGGGSRQGSAGGSGYIGNISLCGKEMFCYECEESSAESTKTISTTNVSEEPISEYAKKGNGYARIAYFNTKEITLNSSRPNTNVTLGDVCNVKKTDEDTTDNNYAGVIIDSHNFIKGKYYIVEYDVQKKSGTLNAIGGHLYSNDNKEFFYLDGVLQNYNYNSLADSENVSQSIDDNNIHHIKVIYKYTGVHYVDKKEEALSINIQPNRGTNVPVEVDIFNIKVYESN